MAFCSCSVCWQADGGVWVRAGQTGTGLPSCWADVRPGVSPAIREAANTGNKAWGHYPSTLKKVAISNISTFGQYCPSLKCAYVSFIIVIVSTSFCLFSLVDLWPRLLGYCEEQGAVGGAGLEEDINDLRLEEENEQPPLILETDWWRGQPDPSVRGRLWCCYSKCDRVGWGGGGVQDQEARGVFKRCSALICSHTFVIFLPQFCLCWSNWRFACTCANRWNALLCVWERVLDVWLKKTNVAMSLKAHWDPGTL